LIELAEQEWEQVMQLKEVTGGRVQEIIFLYYYHFPNQNKYSQSFRRELHQNQRGNAGLSLNI
jgi:hypothetical protein